MKLRIYGEESKKEQEEIYLKLTYLGEHVSLEACDRNGERHSGGSLMLFRNDGTFYRYTVVNEDLPFQLDEKRRIEEDR